MASLGERNAAFDAGKELVLEVVPRMFQGYVHDDVILRITDACLQAAERVREQEHKAKPT